MRRNLRISLVFVMCALFSHFAHAQARLEHTVTRAQQQPPTTGKDFWLCLPTNPALDGGKYFGLHLTSRYATTVQVQVTGGSSYSVTLKPYKTTVFNVPVGWEIPSSGKVEKLGVHVWSSDAEISCSLMSHSSYSSDGMTLIPSIGWGTEYVVAAYGAYVPSSTQNFDLPSQFAIVANHDSSAVTIIPSVNLRMEATAGANCSTIYASQGVPTLIMLNKGECIQLKTTCTQDCDNFDVTGSIVKSSRPVGVICGSECPNIPCDFQYCDDVLEMIPPTRTWSNAYYTVPFYQASGTAASHSASTFLVVASKNNQKIYRYDAFQHSSTLYCQLNKYQTYWRNDIAVASEWFSDTAFLLVQYMNGASYPDNQTGKGDPSELGVSGVEHYQKDMVFQVAIPNGSGQSYSSYINVLAHAGDKNILYDGVSILATATRVQIDGNYVGYRLNDVTTGTHRITSDSGVSVQVYGYGTEESYGWLGHSPIASVNSPDTIPPLVSIQNNCYAAQVTVSDSGGRNAGVYYMRVDSLTNMVYTGDTSYYEGTSVKSLLYKVSVLDPAKVGYIQVSAFDPAGNRTAIVSQYSPQNAIASPAAINFGTSKSTACMYRYDTLVNLGTVPFAFGPLTLAYGDRGFSIDSAVMTPLAVGEHRLVKLCFSAKTHITVSDTLFFTDTCTTHAVALTGTGPDAGFYLTAYDFGHVAVGASAAGQVQVVNISATSPVTIDSMSVDDPTLFVPAPDVSKSWVWVATSANAITIPGAGRATVNFEFRPMTEGPFISKWRAHSPTISDSNGWRSQVLTGNATQDQTVNEAAVGQPIVQLLGHSLLVNSDGLTTIDVVNLLGATVLSATLQPQDAVDVTSLPTGVYLYRVRMNGAMKVGKVAIP